jgi:hypothetical protein
MPFIEAAPSTEDHVTVRRLLPAAAAAQFTTFVAPPERVDTVIVFDTVRVADADSVSRASINNMKAWVDSAAGDAVDLRTVTDSPTTPDRVPAFTDGAPAPDTATPLPLLLTLGAGAIGVGTVLLRRR